VNETIDLSVYKEALLFLATAGVIAPLFFRLRISPVLGYLLAGVALGPYGLGSLARKTPWLGWLALGNVETIDRIAAFGVVFLLFTMGLELSFERLRRMRRLVFGLGLAQVVATMLVLTAIALALGMKPAAALAIGGALAMSSTAIVIPVLIEGKRLAAPVGRASFSVLLFQDLAVAPLLVMVGVFASGGEGGLSAALIGGLVPAALALAALIVFGRLALRPFFHFVAETRSPEFFMAACLLVVLGDGLAAAASKLSMALGAFVAGLLLAETEYRREIEVTIEPFKGLLLGLYFVSVGAGVNPALIIAKPGLILGLAAALIGLKGLILFALARGFRLPLRVGAEMAMLLGPGGEFGFVMIGAALGGGLIDRALSTTLVTAVAISMLAIPPLARLGAMIDARPRPHADGPPEEAPPESEEGRVVIVGYGRVGALIGAMLDMHKVPFVAVDLDARVVARARDAGKPVYYGDASRPDYLRRCGVETARAVVVTMDSPRANEVVVETTRRLRRDVILVGRARDADHARKLYALGVTDAVPETIEASLQLSEAVLVDVGVPMGLVIASIHEKRDEYRAILAAAGAPERPRAARKPRRAEAPWRG
jgi:monovalent cation:H+ antiporter-2, CPA2 family